MLRRLQVSLCSLAQLVTRVLLSFSHSLLYQSFSFLTGGYSNIMYTFGGKYNGGNRGDASGYDRSNLAGTKSVDPQRVNAKMWNHVSTRGSCLTDSVPQSPPTPLVSIYLCCNLVSLVATSHLTKTLLACTAYQSPSPSHQSSYQQAHGGTHAKGKCPCCDISYILCDVILIATSHCIKTLLDLAANQCPSPSHPSSYP